MSAYKRMLKRDMRENVPMAGHYKTRLVRDGPFVAVRIWLAVTPDPDYPDNVMDRSPQWHALADGKEYDVLRLWPWCAKHPIAEPDYRWMLDAAAWDRKYVSNAPAAQPFEPVDLGRMKPIF